MNRFGKRRRVGKWFALVSLLAGMLLMNGCILGFLEPGECVGPGDLEINWLFEGFPSCPDDAASIIVQVTDEDGNNLHTNDQGDEFACNEGRVVFPGLACGSYQIRIQAIDDLDEFSWDSGWIAVSVFGGGVTLRHVNLHQNP